MTDYSSLFPLFWLIPVALQILLPLAILCCWTVVRVVSPSAQERIPEKEEDVPALAAVAN